MLAVFPFGQLLRVRVSFFPRSVTIHPIEIITFLFVICWLVLVRNKSKPAFYIKIFFIFFLISLFSWIVNIARFPASLMLPSFFYLLRLGLWTFFFWAFFDFYKRGRVGEIEEIIAYLGLIISVFSLGQYLFLPDTRFLYYLGWDDHLYRAIGPFLDPSFNGLILVLTLIASLKSFFKSKKPLFLITSVLITASTGLSFSRMSYALFVLSLFFISLMQKKFSCFVLLLSIFSAVIFLSPKPTGEGVNLLRTSTTTAKAANYMNILSIIKENLFFGVGFNNLRAVLLEKGYLSRDNWETRHSGAGADNSFLFVFATTGILGFLVYCYFWFHLVKNGIKPKASKSCVLAVFPVILCLIISAFFINSLFYPWIFCLEAFYFAKLTVFNK